jgi:hypothetical protein
MHKISSKRVLAVRTADKVHTRERRCRNPKADSKEKTTSNTAKSTEQALACSEVRKISERRTVVPSYSKSELAEMERNYQETLGSLPAGTVIDTKTGEQSSNVEDARSTSDRNEDNIGQPACGKTDS